MTVEQGTTKQQGLRRLATVENAALVFAEAGETEPAIRANIFKSQDRINSRGEKIPGNGLAASGAIIRRGRKVLIDLDRYGAWLAGRVEDLPPRLDNVKQTGLDKSEAHCTVYAGKSSSLVVREGDTDYTVDCLDIDTDKLVNPVSTPSSSGKSDDQIRALEVPLEAVRKAAV